MGVASAVQASAMPSIAAESWAMISGFSGLPKFRQLVAATGVAPVHGNLAGSLGHGVHGAKLGIQICPAAVAVQSHGQAALVARACLFP